MKKDVPSQLIAMFFSTILLFCIVFAAITTKDTTWIITSIIFGILYILFGLNTIKIIKNASGKKTKYDINYGFFIVLICIVTIFGVSLYLFINNMSYKLTGEETTATVYNIKRTVDYKTEYDDDGNRYEVKEETCYVYIRYNVEKEEYKSKLDVNTCQYDEGDKLKIYYNKENPSDFVSDSSVGLIIAILISGIALVAFIINSIKDLKRTKKTKKGKK